MGTYKRMYDGDTQSFIEMGVPADRAPDTKLFNISNVDFEKERKVYKHDEQGNAFDVFIFEPRNLFQVSFEYENNDGLYWYSEHEEKGKCFHRFIKVDVGLQQFVIQKDEHSEDLNEIIRANVDAEGARIRVSLNESRAYGQTISFRKLTNFKF